MTQLSSQKFLLPFLLGVAGLITIIISTIIDINNDKIVYITWAASVFIALEALVIRFYSIDIQKFSTLIEDKTLKLDGKKYLNHITAAMVIGLAATIIIAYDFIFGMLSYLVMQVFLILALTRIVPGNIFKIERGRLRNLGLASIIAWVLIIAFDFLVLVYGGPDALIVVPYVVTIGIMAHYTWYGLGFDRPILFRWLPVIASAFFVYSDSIIGINKFGELDVGHLNKLIIDLTYVINIFLMSSAVLFSGTLRE